MHMTSYMYTLVVYQIETITTVKYIGLCLLFS